MKRLALLLLFALSILAPLRGDGVQASFDFFYDTLAPYGEWSVVEGYGYVWRPADVGADWAPYTDGYWAYTDAGWTWVSYEDWGGITYHYGRWIVVRDFGWCWVPDYDWGPAWVSWRTSDAYVGWAPLPPEARWQPDTGFGVWVDSHYEIGPTCYRFCRVRDFGAPVIRNVLLPPAWNVTFIEQTANVTNITYRKDHGCVFNGGLDFAWVAPLLSRPLPTLRLVRNTLNVVAPGRRGDVLINARSGDALFVGAPPPLPGAPGNPQRPPHAARTIAAPVIERGWAGPAKDPVRERIAAKFRHEIQDATPQTAPARPFDPDLVRVIPKHAPPPASRPEPPGTASLPSPVAPVGRPHRPVAPQPPPGVSESRPPEPPPVAARNREAEQRAADAHRRAAEMNALRQRSLPPAPPVEQHRQPISAPDAPRRSAPPVIQQAPPAQPPPRTQGPPPQAGRPGPPPDPNRPLPPDPRRRNP